MLSQFHTDLTLAINDPNIKAFAGIVPLENDIDKIVLRYNRVYTEPIHSKEVADTARTLVRINLYARNDSNESYLRKAIDKLEDVRRFLDGYKNEVGSEYRVEDVQGPDYEDGTDDFVFQMDVMVFFLIDPPSVETSFIYNWTGDFVGTIITRI